MSTRRRKPVDDAADPRSDAAPFPSTEQIAARAHELFVSGGRQITDIPRYWREAESELLEKAARQIHRVHPSRRSR